MPINLSWSGDEKRILIQEFVGKWSLDDYYASLKMLVDEVRAQEHQVHIIADLRKSGPLPPSILSVRSFLEKSLLPNQGTIVIVGGNSLLVTFIDIIRPFAPHFVRSVAFAKTPEMAFEKIAEWERDHMRRTA